MKTSNWVKLSLVIVAVAFTSTVTGYIFGVRANNKTDVKQVKKEAAAELVSKKEEAVKKETETAVITQSYILKDKDGRISLYHKYSDGRETIYKEYDISVKSLPESDREALKEGIEVTSLSDALQLIEDYY